MSRLFPPFDYRKALLAYPQNRRVMRALPEYLEVVVSMSVIAGDPGVIPIFLGLTNGRDRVAKRKTAALACVTALATLVIAIYLGESLFRLLSISIPSFRVAGGVLLFLMGLELVRGPSLSIPAGSDPASTAEEPGVVPLGIPLLAGPGLISTVMIQSQEFQSWQDNIALVICSALAIAYVWIMLAFSDVFARLLGSKGLEIAARVSGLVVLAISVEFIAAGVAALARAS